MIVGDADEVDGEFFCDRKCTALRGCARHMCGRVCCPLAALSGIESSGGKGKGKKKEIPTEAELKELDPKGWHICDLVSAHRNTSHQSNHTEPTLDLS